MLKNPFNLKVNVKLPVIYKYKNMDNKKFPTNNNYLCYNKDIVKHRESIEKRSSINKK